MSRLWASRGPVGMPGPLALQPAHDGHALNVTVAAGLDGPPIIVVRVERDDVRDLVQALDDWLFDSRPA